MATEWTNYTPAQTSEKRTTVDGCPGEKNTDSYKQREVDASDEVGTRKMTVVTCTKVSKTEVSASLCFLTIKQTNVVTNKIRK